MDEKKAGDLLVSPLPHAVSSENGRANAHKGKQRVDCSQSDRCRDISELDNGRNYNDRSANDNCNDSVEHEK